jgi:hypothetical protein
VGLASKVTWGQWLVSGGGPKPCFMRLWDVDVKPRGSSRPRGLSVNGWLGKADLGLALCGSGMLIVQPRNASITRYWSVNIVRRALTRVSRNVA